MQRDNLMIAVILLVAVGCGAVLGLVVGSLLLSIAVALGFGLPIALIACRLRPHPA